MNKRATKRIDNAATGRGPTFQSKNPRLQEYLRLSEEHQLELWQAARQKNLDWLTRTFAALPAGWIMVIDGEVTRCGASLGDFPSDEELTRIEQESGKFPFVFLSDDLLAVEESAGWAGSRRRVISIRRSCCRWRAMLASGRWVKNHSGPRGRYESIN